jgi:hypothetical protein
MLALAGPASAKDAFRRGPYLGKVDNRSRIDIVVDRASVGIPRIGVPARCPDGKIRAVVSPASLALIQEGKDDFVLSHTVPAKELTVRGALQGYHASGTFRLHVRVNAVGTADPAGEQLCDTGTLRWTATLPIAGGDVGNHGIGTYKGYLEKTQTHIAFTATSVRLKRMVLSSISVRCSNDLFLLRNDIAGNTGRLKHGRISDRLVGIAWDLRFTATLSKKKAFGVLRITGRINDLGVFDPHGSAVCDSGPLKWKAVHK